MSPIKHLEDRPPRPTILGQIRLGVINARGHPQQSKTFVFSARDRMWLEPLAKLYGGTIESYIPQGDTEPSWRLVSETEALWAILPYGSHWEQWYELRSASRLHRRCDSVESQLFDVDEQTGELTSKTAPCVCAETGKLECSPTTSLFVYLPQTGMGAWRLVTHSKMAADELQAAMRQIDELVEGLGDRFPGMLPVRISYEPKRTSYWDPKAKARKPTTKRIPRVILAGTPEQFANALTGASPIRGIVELARPSDQRALPSGSSTEAQEPDTEGGGESKPAGRDSPTNASPPSSPLHRYEQALTELADVRGMTAAAIKRDYVTPWIRKRRDPKTPAGKEKDWPAEALEEITTALQNAIEMERQVALDV